MRMRRWGAVIAAGAVIATLVACEPRGADRAAEFFDAEDVPLATAVADGDAERIRTLVADGADPDAVGEDDLTMLQWAVREGEPESAAVLLDLGADPEVVGYLGRTALYLATGDPEVVEVLLDGGADPNGGEGASALVAACLDAEADSMRLLLEAGADPDHADANGDTALLTCARGNQGALILLLLESGADPTLATSSGTTFQDHYFGYDADLLNDAARQERREIAEWLEAHGHDLVPEAEPFR